MGSSPWGQLQTPKLTPLHPPLPYPPPKPPDLVLRKAVLPLAYGYGAIQSELLLPLSDRLCVSSAVHL